MNGGLRMNNEERIVELLTEIRDSLKKPEKKALKKGEYMMGRCKVVKAVK